MPQRIYSTPGVYKQDIFPVPGAEIRTGIPAFLGRTTNGQAHTPALLTLWPQFEAKFGQILPDSYLAYCVRGFFENGGRLCYVVPLEDYTAGSLDRGLDAAAAIDAIDLICAPEIVKTPSAAPELQQKVLDHCASSGDRFAILDSIPGTGVEEVLGQRRQLDGINGALYYPSLRIMVERNLADRLMTLPPCGHVAGVFARSDQRIGLHKAPANEVLEGVLDLEVNINNELQDRLNPEDVNCLRAFPGRGIRVWGARTLAGSEKRQWKYINVRRLILSVGRWVEQNLSDVVFEPHNARLRARIGRELNAYFNDLFQQGALKGSTAREAFYVKCDAETNPPEVRNAGMVITEIGLAPTVPGEFVVVHIRHGDGGLTLNTAIRTE
jgi:phage tail sheath protein FI